MKPNLLKINLLLSALLLPLTGCTAAATKTLPVTPVTPNTPSTPAETEFVALPDGYQLTVTFGSQYNTYRRDYNTSEIKYKPENQSITVTYKRDSYNFTDYFYGPTVTYAVYAY